MKELVLIRHGESMRNKENRFTGWVHMGLIETVDLRNGFGGIFLKMFWPRVCQASEESIWH